MIPSPGNSCPLTPRKRTLSRWPGGYLGADEEQLVVAIRELHQPATCTVRRTQSFHGHHRAPRYACHLHTIHTMNKSLAQNKSVTSNSHPARSVPSPNSATLHQCTKAAANRVQTPLAWPSTSRFQLIYSVPECNLPWEQSNIQNGP
jgi:hypothetical protein